MGRGEDSPPAPWAYSESPLSLSQYSFMPIAHMVSCHDRCYYGTWTARVVVIISIDQRLGSLDWLDKKINRSSQSQHQSGNWGPMTCKFDWKSKTAPTVEYGTSDLFFLILIFFDRGKFLIFDPFWLDCFNSKPTYRPHTQLVSYLSLSLSFVSVASLNYDLFRRKSLRNIIIVSVDKQLPCRH